MIFSEVRKNKRAVTNTLVFLSLIIILLTSSSFSYAQGLTIATDPTSLESIAGLLAKGVNVAAWGSGAIFLVMLFITAIKYSMSQGDPKGLEGAKNTLTYAIFGFLVALSFFTISSIIVKGLGLGEGLISSPTKSMTEGLKELTEFLTPEPEEEDGSSVPVTEEETDDGSGYSVEGGGYVEDDAVIIHPDGTLTTNEGELVGQVIYFYVNRENWEEKNQPSDYPELDTWENSSYDVWCDGTGSCGNNPANVKVAEYSLEADHAIDLSGDGVWFNERRGVVVESHDFVGRKIDGRPITGFDTQGCWQYLDELGTTYCDD